MNELFIEGRTSLTPRVRDHVVVCAVAAVLIVSGLVHLGVFFLDDRPWGGPLSWRKPFTFGVSFGLTLLGVLWVVGYLDLSSRIRSALVAVFTADCLLEVGGITVQAWRDQPSHLNTTTPFNAVVAYALAAGGGVLIVVLGTFAVVALRGRVRGEPSLTIAIRAGFAFLLVGLASGAAMIVRGNVVERTRGTWAGYLAAGFLKDLHAVTLHAVLVLPLLAVALGRVGVPETSRRRVVLAAVALYALGAVAVFVLDLARA